MKGIISIVLASLLLTAPGIQDNINNAIKSANSQVLAQYFNNTIDLSVLSQENVYSKAQAEQILKNFFANHKPTSFRIGHEGKANDGSMYFIIKLGTNNGNYRIYYLLKQTGNQLLIHKFRIDTDNDE
ncbi:MAG: DUF4783 domain-containing protein [Flavobacteriales bacterium]